ncbi:hypothetical protein JCM8097_007850 [Rhodosporidiobolus ruineniae]
MADPHSVPLPASRGSLDSVRSEQQHPPSASAPPLPALDEQPTPPADEPPAHDFDPAPPTAADAEPVTVQDQVGDDDDAAWQLDGEQQEQQHSAYEAAGDSDDRIRQLEDELERTRADRDAFEGQYQGLLAKLTAMRNTLGDKLKQDADELDRREQEIADLRGANDDLQAAHDELQSANDDLSAALETLKSELIQSHADADALQTEVEQLRNRAFDSERQSSDEAQEREIALREAQEDLERVRIERDEWEGEAMRERVRREEAGSRLAQVEVELAQAKTERESLREERDREQESAANLHAVLEEFQAAKDRELQSLLGDLQNQLHDTTQELEVFRQRATTAEGQLAAAQNDSQKVLALAQEVKEKNLLIGKLRHEAVILNEHLTEALRRLKRNASENSVDQRLVSNVLITFLNTPRGDTKRFEMLQLIASILNWTDDQREKVGLQRAAGSLSSSSVIASGSRGGGKGHARSGKGKAVDEGVENESFSNLWIEFLLKEATSDDSRSRPAASPSSPPLSSGPLSPSSNPPSASPFGRFDLPSLGSPPASSPPISLGSTRRPSLSSVLSNGSSTAPTSTAPPSIKEEEQ